MKTIISFLLVTVASVFAADQPMRGVAGVEVRVKENPAKSAVTDAHGSFVLQGLSPGRYTLIFKSQAAKDSKAPSTGSVAVAQNYSIQVRGTKQAVNQSALANQISAGVTVAVEVSAGAKISGVVGATHATNMVWIPPQPGTNFPGHWVPADSPEAKGHGARSVQWMKGQDVQNMIDSHDPMHQEGFPTGR
ncbi:MAG: carboxypeptidase regulatory-like domain-containing protein [Chthoniobacterales bacterium]